MLSRNKGPEEGRKLKSGDLRVSNADRTDAVRRLEAHESVGHLSKDEVAARLAHVDAATTPTEIAKVFVDLPMLSTRSPSIERRISTQDRVAAVDLLGKAHSEGRITADEYAAATAQVHVARTRSEIDAAFHGLSSPTRTAAVKTASKAAKQTAELTSRVVAEGGRRAGNAFRRTAYAVGALSIGAILAFAGIGTAALIFFVGAVLLFVAAAVSLTTSRSSA